MGEKRGTRNAQFFWGETCAKTRDATSFVKCSQAQDAKAIQGRAPSSGDNDLRIVKIWINLCWMGEGDESNRTMLISCKQEELLMAGSKGELQFGWFEQPEANRTPPGEEDFPDPTKFWASFICILQVSPPPISGLDSQLIMGPSTPLNSALLRALTAFQSRLIST